jgi:hypothetical protein
MQIQEITPQAIRVLWDGRETRLTRSPRMPPQASNQAMERTPTRSAFAFRVAWIRRGLRERLEAAGLVVTRTDPRIIVTF